ncbi:MAG TPA: hypothetical protein VH560_03545, partial [Polyangia bacterium]|nr:hypothetical protein [Polyangia bacterium]
TAQAPVVVAGGSASFTAQAPVVVAGGSASMKIDPSLDYLQRGSGYVTRWGEPLRPHDCPHCLDLQRGSGYVTRWGATAVKIAVKTLRLSFNGAAGT